jgi:hypothetical protein
MFGVLTAVEEGEIMSDVPKNPNLPAATIQGLGSQNWSAVRQPPFNHGIRDDSLPSGS